MNDCERETSLAKQAVLSDNWIVRNSALCLTGCHWHVWCWRLGDVKKTENRNSMKLPSAGNKLHLQTGSLKARRSVEKLLLSKVSDWFYILLFYVENGCEAQIRWSFRCCFVLSAPFTLMCERRPREGTRGSQTRMHACKPALSGVPKADTKPNARGDPTIVRCAVVLHIVNVYEDCKDW
jgi:hypothetical protein